MQLPTYARPSTRLDECVMRSVIETMMAKYPGYGNLTTLGFSAGGAFQGARAVGQAPV